MMQQQSRRMAHCGCFAVIHHRPQFLPLVSLDAHTSILSSTSRTTLIQTFANPSNDSPLKEARYMFPLYDGVTVVGFTCTIGSTVIRGVVEERHEAKQKFQAAVNLGEAAGLLEQSKDASDAFTTTLGNVPAGEKVKVEITYLGELKHDAQVDGLRFTIPTNIAPRYGKEERFQGPKLRAAGGISVTIDVDMSDGSSIRSIQSPSHPISVNIGTTSKDATAAPSLQRAHATLSHGSAELDNDFILQVVATGLGEPAAILENHPTLPNQRALMTTLVPRFNLPVEHPEVVFVCDRSGSMQSGAKMPNLISALQIFLKSLPVGVKFNICSFGSRFSFLWERSQTYSQDTLDSAIEHVKTFAADYGGTEMQQPLAETFSRRYKDMNLEVFLLTDGETWDQANLFTLINHEVAQSNGDIRLFTLGVGEDVSHALIEGVARAGNGFSQTVATNEKMDKKLIRMLKGALTPHINDYTLEIKYAKEDQAASDDDFEIVEKVMDALTIDLEAQAKKPLQPGSEHAAVPQQPISLFDSSLNNDDLDMPDARSIPPVQLPSVVIPRYLQAPFKIPGLYSFNRTIVYILLSDSTPNRQPKSVLLKGTSKHGPLMLEIPITTLTEKGLTIHQLAARKAVGELEEGRGWIFHAKTADDKLLKDEYDGRFNDMVQREAVRLGTTYQVGGKWCSFVAVIDKHQQSEKRAKEENTVGDFEVIPFGSPSTRGGGRALGRGGAVRSRRMMMASVAAPAPTPAPGGFSLMAASAAPGKKKKPLQAMQMMMAKENEAQAQNSNSNAPPVQQMQASSRPITQAYGRTINPPSQTENVLSDFDFDSFLHGQDASNPPPGSHSNFALDTRATNPAFQDYQMQTMLLEQQNKRRLMMARQSKAGGAAARTWGGQPVDPVSALARLQAFAGNWQWGDELQGLLGITKDQALAKISSAAPYAGNEDVLATVCAVVYLKTKQANERDTWELFVDKAESWLSQQLGQTSESLQKEVKEGLFP